jgi:hypothetical protein
VILIADIEGGDTSFKHDDAERIMNGTGRCRAGPEQMKKRELS